MKKTLLAIALCCAPGITFAAQTPVTTIDKFNSATTTINNLREATNTKLGVIEANRQDHVANIATKADKAQVVRYWADHADGTQITAKTLVAYDGKIYTTLQAFDKVSSSATPDILTTYFEVSSGSGGTNDYNDLINTPTIPTALADLSTDATHRVVTDAEKTTWNAGASDDQTAAEVPVVDSGLYYAGTNVEAVLQEIGAYQVIAFDPLTLTTTTSGTTDTIGVKASTFQAYDANMITWPSSISATEIGYLDGLTGALSASLASRKTVVVSGSSTLAITEIPANSCSLQPFTATGAVASTDKPDAYITGRLSTIVGYGVTSTGSLRIDVYLTDGNINFDVCNPTGAAITPGSATLKWDVLR